MPGVAIYTGTVLRSILTTTSGPLALTPTVPPAARVPWGAGVHSDFIRGQMSEGIVALGAGKAGTYKYYTGKRAHHHDFTSGAPYTVRPPLARNQRPIAPLPRGDAH